MQLLVAEFEKQTLAQRKHGGDRFEALLEPLGFSGPVDPEVRRNLISMHHIRDVIVHRASRADRRIVEACPWLRLQVGDEVIVNRNNFPPYQAAAWMYVLVLAQRLDSYFVALQKPPTAKATPSPEDEKAQFSH